MTSTRLYKGVAIAASFGVLAFAAPAAQAKQAKLDGQLIGAASTKGSKVSAPVLLTEKSAKKLKLRSPVATLTTSAKKTIAAPSPTGGGTVQIAASTLRSGDTLAGKAKAKGNRKALVPTLQAKNLKVTDRESAYSVDELTAALVELYRQVGVLTLRLDAADASIAELRRQLEELRAQNASLEGQINNLLAQLTDLEATVQTLEDLIAALPTAEDLNEALAEIADLQQEIQSLNEQIDAITGTVCGLVPLAPFCP